MINTHDLELLRPILKISQIAKMAQIPINTINGKIKNNRDLTISESQRISQILLKYGINYNRTPSLTEPLFKENQ